MASTSRYGNAYQKLPKLEGLFGDDSGSEINLREKVIGRRTHRSFIRLRKFHFRRKLKVRIPRLLKKKARLLRAAWRKVVKRLKENQGHFGDLFAGNYLFMQVSPTPFKSTAPNKSLPSHSVGRDLSCRQMSA